MKKCNKIIASLLAGVLLVSSVGVLPTEASYSDATVYVKEDFEGEEWNDFVIEDTTGTVTMNTYSGGGTMTHNSRSTSHINAAITDDVDNKVLTITENSMNAARNIYFTYANGNYCSASDKFVFQFSLKDTATSFGEFSCKIEGQNSSNESKAVTLLTVKNGTLTLSNTTAPSYNLSKDSWTTVRVAVNFSTKKYDVHIGDNAHTGITLPTIKNMKWFRFDISSGTNSGAIKIDNVALYQADEVVKDAFAEPTAIQLDQTEIHLNVNDTTTLTPTITTDGFEPAVTWTTNDETIATVNNGIVTAVAAGTATITATAGDVSAECNVSIRKELLKENFAGENWHNFVIEDTTGTVTMNTYSGGGTMTHNSRSTSHINAAITDDESNKVLTIAENSMNAARNIYFTYANGSYCSASDKFVFQFSLKDTATSFGEFSCKIEGQNSSNESKAVTLLTVKNGTLTLSNTTAPSYNLSKDSWTTVRVAVDFSTKKYDVHIGDNAHTGITLPTIKNMKWFRFDISSGTNSGAIKIDNVALYQVADANTVLEDIFYATVDGTNLTLDDGNIGIKYHVNTDNLLSTKADKMQFTMDGEVTEVVNTDGQYIFKYGVPAKMMTETITAQLVDANGKALMYPVEYSIRDNALAIINGAEENADYEAAAPLATAMLNYGAYAQQYFGVNTDNLANAGVETDITSVSAELLSAYTGSDYVSVTGDTSIGSLVGTVVTLESNTYLKYYFLLDGSLSIDNLTFTDGEGNTLTATTNNGYCEVVIEGIKATDLNTPYTVVISDGTNTLSATYCVMTNVYNVLAADEGTYDDSHIDVCKVLYLYNVAADEYFAAATE